MRKCIAVRGGGRGRGGEEGSGGRPHDSWLGLLWQRSAGRCRQDGCRKRGNNTRPILERSQKRGDWFSLLSCRLPSVPTRDLWLAPPFFFVAAQQCLLAPLRSEEEKSTQLKKSSEDSSFLVVVVVSSSLLLSSSLLSSSLLLSFGGSFFAMVAVWWWGWRGRGPTTVLRDGKSVESGGPAT